KNKQLREADARRATLIQNLEHANSDFEHARDRAENHLELALRAIDHFHRSVSLHLDIRDRPDLKPLRTELLATPLEFYREIKQDLSANAPSSPKTQTNFAEAVASLARITAEIDSVPNAIRGYQEAIDVLNTLQNRHPDVATYRYSLSGALCNLARLQG